MAEKSKKRISVILFPSVMKSAFSVFLPIDSETLKTILGRMLVKLIDEKNNPKSTTALAIVVANDKLTLRFIKPYFPFLKKSGIKIFLVKNMKEVERCKRIIIMRALQKFGLVFHSTFL